MAARAVAACSVFAIGATVFHTLFVIFLPALIAGVAG